MHLCNIHVNKTIHKSVSMQFRELKSSYPTKEITQDHLAKL